MRKLCAFLLIALLPATPESHAGPLVALSSHTYIEAITSLSIHEIWQSTEPFRHVEGSEGIVAYATYDYEDLPVRGDLFGCGWVLIGKSDLGVVPVGVRVWSDRQECDLKVTADDNAGSASVDAFIMSLKCKSLASHDWELKQSVAIRIAVGSKEVLAGSKVSIAGHVVGTIN
jgi:hypothetical protein